MYNNLHASSTLTQTALCPSQNIHPYWSTRVCIAFVVSRSPLVCPSAIPYHTAPAQYAEYASVLYFVPSELVSNSILACPSECQYRFNSRSSQVLLFVIPFGFSFLVPLRCCTVQIGCRQNRPSFNF